MQLERILQKHGFGTRKECRTLCWDGRVAVNGQPCDQPFADVDSAGLVLTVEQFGWNTLLPALIVGATARLAAGRPGLYVTHH